MLIAFPKIDTWHAIQLDIELNDIQLSFSLTSWSAPRCENIVRRSKNK